MYKIVKTTTETYNGFIRRGVYVEHAGAVKQYAALLTDSASTKEIEDAQSAMLKKEFGFIVATVV